MEDFYPSEVARLVLGYLKEVKCLNTWQMFMKESADLQEHYRLYKEGRVYCTDVDGKSLLGILQEYRSLKRESRRINALYKEASVLTLSENGDTAGKDVSSSKDIIKQVTTIIQIFEYLFSLFKNHKVSDVMSVQDKETSADTLSSESLAALEKLRSNKNLSISNPSTAINNVANKTQDNSEIPVINSMQLHTNSLVEPSVSSNVELSPVNLSSSCAYKNVKPSLENEVIVLSSQKAPEDNSASLSAAKVNGHDKDVKLGDTVSNEQLAIQDNMHSSEKHLVSNPSILENNVDMNLAHESTETPVVNRILISRNDKKDRIRLYSNSIVKRGMTPIRKTYSRMSSRMQRDIPVIEERRQFLSCPKGLKDFAASLSSAKAYIDHITNDKNETNSTEKEAFGYPYSAGLGNNGSEKLNSSHVNTLSNEQIHGGNNLGSSSSNNFGDNIMEVDETHVSKELCNSNSNSKKSENEITIHSVVGSVDQLINDKKDSESVPQNNIISGGNILLSNIPDAQNCANLYTPAQCVKFSSPHSVQPVSSPIQPVTLVRMPYSSVPTLFVANNGFQYVVNNPSMNLSSNNNGTILPIQTFSTTGNVYRTSGALDHVHENNPRSTMPLGTGGIIQPSVVGISLTQGPRIGEISVTSRIMKKTPLKSTSSIVDEASSNTFSSQRDIAADIKAVEKSPEKKKKSHRKAIAADPPAQKYSRPSRKVRHRIFFSPSSSESDKEEQNHNIKNKISTSTSPDSKLDQSPVLASLISSAKLLSLGNGRIATVVKSPLNFEYFPNLKNESPDEIVHSVQNQRVRSYVENLCDSYTSNSKKTSRSSKLATKQMPSKSKKAKKKSPKKKYKNAKLKKAVTETLINDTVQRVAANKPVSNKMASTVLNALEKTLQVVEVPENEEFVCSSQTSSCKLSGTDKADQYMDGNISSMLMNGVSFGTLTNEVRLQSEMGSAYNLTKSFEKSVVCKNQFFTQSDELNKQCVNENIHIPCSNSESVVKGKSSDSEQQSNEKESYYDANKTIENLEHYTNCRVVLKCLSLTGNAASIIKKPETLSEISESSSTETALSQNEGSNNFDSSKSAETCEFAESVEKIHFLESSVESKLQKNDINESHSSSTIYNVCHQQNLNELSVVIKKEEDSSPSSENGFVSHSIFESANENINSSESIKVEEFEYTNY